MKKLYTADWILPVSEKPVRNGAILVENGLIADVNHVAMLSKRYHILPEKFEKSVIAPAWVNAHCHLELSYLKNLVSRGGSFTSWVRSLVSAREENIEAGRMQESFTNELEKLSKTGTALVGDLTNGAFLEPVKSETERVVFYELLGFKKDKAHDLYNNALAQIEPSRGEIHLAPHALYSTSAELVKLILDHGTISTIHISESPDEMIFLNDGSGPMRKFLEEKKVWDDFWKNPGQSPVQYLKKIGALPEKLILVHGVHFTHDDMALIKDSGNTICLCVRSNNLLGSGMPPVYDFLQYQIPLCIGTDSLASNHDLDMNEEVAYLSACFPGLDHAEILKMGTLNGAQALGKGHEYGALSKGRKARFNVFSGPEIKNMKPETFILTKSWSTLTCY